MLDVAIVGAGGRGADDIADLLATGAVNIVALCDCDDAAGGRDVQEVPGRQAVLAIGARCSTRRRTIDAVLVRDARPQPRHRLDRGDAARQARLLREAAGAQHLGGAARWRSVAAEKGVATQMGTQGHAFEGTRRAVEVMRAGVIGEVQELHVWTDRPAGWWPQGVARPTETPPVPPGLDWDVWLGPAPKRPYNPAYVPFKWRGFWDFGTGAIGDMGIHNLDTAYWGLELGTPTSVEVKDCSPALTTRRAKETAPLWSIIELQFPARGDKPPVKMTWYDGGKLPPKELFQGEKLIEHDGGSLVIGTKGTLFTRTWHGGENDERHVRPAAAQAVRGCPDAQRRRCRARRATTRSGWTPAAARARRCRNFGYASRADGVAAAGQRRAAHRQDDRVGSRRDARHGMPGGGRLHKARVPERLEPRLGRAPARPRPRGARSLKLAWKKNSVFSAAI